MESIDISGIRIGNVKISVFADTNDFAPEIGETVFDDIALFLFHRDHEIDVFQKFVLSNRRYADIDTVSRMTEWKMGRSTIRCNSRSPAEPMVIRYVFQKTLRHRARKYCETNYENILYPRQTFS